MACDQNVNHVEKEEVKEEQVEEVEQPVEEVVDEESEETNDKEEDLFKLTKDEQVTNLKDLGLTNKDIKKLKTEIERVNKIIELTN